jgi:hypothetical protein
MGNEAGLTQYFSNLLENAVKFCRPGVPAPRVEDRETALRLGATELVEKGTDPRHFRNLVHLLNYRGLRLGPCENFPPS